MQKRIAVVSLTAALSAAAAMAAPASPADYNGDGRISQEEFRNQVARTAHAADKNANGVLEEGEMKLSPEHRKAMDTNGDGALSIDEFQAGQMAAFGELDKNGDGFLDAAEMKG